MRALFAIVPLISVSCMAATAGNSSSVSTAGANAPLLGEIDSIFAAYNHADTPGASVTVVHNGQVVASRSYGLADVEARVPITEQTNFRLASLTKQFTATAILLLVKDAKLRLDDRVADLLPGFPAHASDATVRNLLTHTSGIWTYDD